KGDSFLAVAMRHVNDPVPSITDVRPDVPLRLDAARRRAMAKTPDDGSESRSACVKELESVIGGLGQPDSDRTTIMPPVEPARPGVGGRAARGGSAVWCA